MYPGIGPETRGSGLSRSPKERSFEQDPPSSGAAPGESRAPLSFCATLAVIARLMQATRARWRVYQSVVKLSAFTAFRAEACREAGVQARPRARPLGGCGASWQTCESSTGPTRPT
jgi:hypothetical protein